MLFIIIINVFLHFLFSSTLIQSRHKAYLKSVIRRFFNKLIFCTIKLKVTPPPPIVYIEWPQLDIWLFLSGADLPQKIRESQNYRMVEIGRGPLEVNWSKHPAQLRNLEPSAQDYVQADSSEEGKSTISPSNKCPVWSCQSCDVQLEPHVFVCAHCFLSCWWATLRRS